jgi:tRNA(Ile)-lysidine synthase
MAEKTRSGGAGRQGRPSGFAAAVLETCRRRRLLGAGDRVLVALSGGPDSTALLSALCELREAGLVGSVAALHVDHGLRPGSGNDAMACAALCDRLPVAFRSVRVEVRPGNVQAEARRARYRALREEAEAGGATRIATGHTLSDQAETVILRLLRGAGARGLAGIPPRRGPLVRPLIDRSRSDVLAYLASRGLPFLEDPSNATPRFQRNRARMGAMPALRELAPQAERALARAADLLRADERALSARAALRVDGAEAEVADLLAEPLAVRRRAVRRMWRAAAGTSRGLEARHVDAVLRLLRRTAPGRVTLGAGLEALVAYGRLEIRPRPTAAERPAPVELPGPGRHRLPDGRWLELVVDPDGPGDPVEWPLSWRTRLPGDRFRPAGGRGGKKLKAWLIDRKVPREERDRLRVLADASGRVLWIPALDAVAECPGFRAWIVAGTGR